MDREENIVIFEKGTKAIQGTPVVLGPVTNAMSASYAGAAPTKMDAHSNPAVATSYPGTNPAYNEPPPALTTAVMEDSDFAIECNVDAANRLPKRVKLKKKKARS